MTKLHDPYDAAGVRIRRSAIVRILGTPDLSSIGQRDPLRTREVFRYLVGRYKRVGGFGPAGHVELLFRIRGGRLRGLHTVSIEPQLLRVRRPRPNRAGAADAAKAPRG